MGKLYACTIRVMVDQLDRAIAINRAQPHYASSDLPEATRYLQSVRHILLERSLADVAVEQPEVDARAARAAIAKATGESL